ncbi:MAG: hypothetical protein ACI35W_03440 [Anaeroplasmataceae bacterium]
MRKILERLCVLICGCLVAVSTFTSNKESVLTPTRDVEIANGNISKEAVFKEFDNVEEKVIDGFYCVKASKKYSNNDFNEVDLCSDSISNDVNVEYQIGYDYTHKKIMVDISTDSMETELNEIEFSLLVGDVIFKEDGRIDALFTDEDGSFYLSEFYDYSLIQNCSWLSKILKKAALVVGVVASVVIVVATSVPTLVIATVAYVGSIVSMSVINSLEAKQHQTALENYKINCTKKFPVNNNTNNDNSKLYGFITNQGASEFEKMNLGKNSNLRIAGCEIIASYNAMKMIGKNTDFATTAFDIECLDILFLSNGEYGSNPYDLGCYYKKRNASYKYTSNILEYYNYMEKNDVVSVVSFANKDFFKNGLHTFTVSKLDGNIYTFNSDYSNNYGTLDNICDCGNGYSSFLCSYVFDDGWAN